MSESLVAIVREAWRRALEIDPTMARAAATLVTIAEKDRPVLHQAGAELGLPVLILPKQALRGTEDRITVPSPAAKVCFGIPSVAEAAALAAAGPGSRLLVARISLPDATCAIAAAVRRAVA